MYSFSASAKNNASPSSISLAKKINKMASRINGHKLEFSDKTENL